MGPGSVPEHITGKGTDRPPAPQTPAQLELHEQIAGPGGSELIQAPVSAEAREGASRLATGERTRIAGTLTGRASQTIGRRTAPVIDEKKLADQRDQEALRKRHEFAYIITMAEVALALEGKDLAAAMHVPTAEKVFEVTPVSGQKAKDLRDLITQRNTLLAKAVFNIKTPVPAPFPTDKNMYKVPDHLIEVMQAGQEARELEIGKRLLVLSKGPSTLPIELSNVDRRIAAFMAGYLPKKRKGTSENKSGLRLETSEEEKARLKREAEEERQRKRKEELFQSACISAKLDLDKDEENKAMFEGLRNPVFLEGITIQTVGIGVQAETIQFSDKRGEFQTTLVSPDHLKDALEFVYALATTGQRPSKEELVAKMNVLSK